MYKTVQINYCRKVLCVTAYPCVLTSVPLTYVWAFGFVGFILLYTEYDVSRHSIYVLIRFDMVAHNFCSLVRQQAKHVGSAQSQQRCLTRNCYCWRLRLQNGDMFFQFDLLSSKASKPSWNSEKKKRNKQVFTCTSWCPNSKLQRMSVWEILNSFLMFPCI